MSAGERRQLFGIPLPKDKLETDITEYGMFFNSLITERDFPLQF